jgi:SAM-dependent methyltransferase
MSNEMPEGTVELMSSIGGIVLDVGPGSGTQLHLFNPAKITKMYGVEPAVDLHAELLRSAKKESLGDKYEVIAAGAEPQSLIPALAKKNMLKTSDEKGSGIFDSIACIRVLCGVPGQEDTAAGLYRLLKPGGRLIVCEHVGHMVAISLRRLCKDCTWCLVGGSGLVVAV